MEFKTKYNIGDTVFYMEDNCVKSNKIEIITIRQYKDSQVNDHNSQSYIEYCGIGHFTLKEHNLYTSKEELIKSL